MGGGEKKYSSKALASGFVRAGRPAYGYGDQSIAYIDLEASGLNDKSWPIEVGWAIGDGVPTALLIRPQKEWENTAWDTKAEVLHGIARIELENHGHDAAVVCKKLNNALAGKTVVSDAPDWDGFWLYRLHEAAQMKQSFVLSHFADLMPPLRVSDKMQLVAKANAAAPHTHRAESDVRHMQMLHQLALEAV